MWDVIVLIGSCGNMSDSSSYSCAVATESSFYSTHMLLHNPLDTSNIGQYDSVDENDTTTHHGDVRLTTDHFLIMQVRMQESQTEDPDDPGVPMGVDWVAVPTKYKLETCVTDLANR